MAKNIADSRIPITNSVLRALRGAGSRNTWTPLAMASIPVIAEQPELNARKIKNSPKGSMA